MKSALLSAATLLAASAACSHVAGTSSSEDEAPRPSAASPLATTTTPASSGADAPAAARRGIVIGHVKTHDAKISIVGGRAGKDLRVDVRKEDGTVVAEGATLDELRARAPELYRVVTSAVAQERGTYVDATLDHVPAPSSAAASPSSNGR